MNSPDFSPILTERLELVASSLEIEKAVLYDRKLMKGLTRCSVPDDWPGKDWIEVLPSLIESYKENPQWCMWNRIIVSKNDRTFAGSVGCAFPPSEDGGVSIGYYISPEFRKRGFALEAVRAYFNWLKSQPGVKTIKAECFAGNEASLKILKKIGLVETGFTKDEEGTKIQWEAKLKIP